MRPVEAPSPAAVEPPTVPGGVVTGLGAIDTVDPRLAARIAIQEAPDLPHVPELPLRGPWAQPLGRLGALLVDLPVELEAGRWRLASGGGRDLRRARAMVGEDLDAVEEQWNGYSGMAKLQVLGPLSAAATLELRGGEAVASDSGAVDDLTASLVEGVAEHVVELSRRVPGATWVAQIDEPVAADLVRGRVRRSSGWGVVDAMPAVDAAELLRRVVRCAHDEGAGVVVHSCDAAPDWGLLTGSGADVLSVPLPRLDDDLLGWAGPVDSWWNDGRGLWAAVERPEDVSGSVAAARLLASVMGADADQLARRLVLTPRCGWAPGRRPGAPEVAAPVGAQAYADVRALLRQLAQG